MKAIITIEFTIDGEHPSRESLEAAVFKLTSDAGYIGSEEIDGTDDWGLEIGTTTVSIEDEKD